MRGALLAALFAVAACQQAEPAPPSAAEAQAFLAGNKAQAGVVTTATGLQYRIVRAGPKDRPTAKEGDEVKVHYEGKLLDGRVFDSSYQQGAPAVFTVGQLVAGWNEALQLMRPGDEMMLWVPPELGYGEEGAPPDIPPNSVLVFRMEMLDVLPRSGGIGFG
ncbi:MAG TPA: FKBP-type peptidyl-prolyl cis-trans isomerase [Caulobacteraceae bacterium]|jgi:peptidylprolyl isomerase/FKBP-type peptidyl-prolyl cis-trans isomerase FklB